MTRPFVVVAELRTRAEIVAGTTAPVEKMRRRVESRSDLLTAACRASGVRTGRASPTAAMPSSFQAGCAGPCGLLPAAASTCRATSRVAGPLHRGSNRTGSTTRGANAAVPGDAAIPRRGPGEPPAKPVWAAGSQSSQGSGGGSWNAEADSCGPWRRPDRSSCEARPEARRPWRIDFARRARLRKTAWKTSSASWVFSTNRRAVPSTMGPWRAISSSKASRSSAVTKRFSSTASSGGTASSHNRRRYRCNASIDRTDMRQILVGRIRPCLISTCG